MKGIGKALSGITAILTAMLVSVNGRSPTRSFSLGATTLAGVVLPEGGADEERDINTWIN